ncbi:hypothetical protein [Photobacterium indicum]|uniref:Uncharacterized protein n=1 Tax=Photobacterium indicum TaxID=81447 RepID=A0A2T3LEJ4_9GAMM|nr:hypothetical protein [Photobacterium indicum]PSV49802.1 hypothetical protein C9J47_04390 [Photobacterium indicum]
MNELNELVSFYFDKAREIKSATERLTSTERTFKDIFTKQQVKQTQEKITTYYKWLNEADDKYLKHLVIKRVTYSPAAGPTEMERQAAEITVVSKAREMFIQSLSSFEKDITEVESTLNFRLTTTLAVLAIIISALGGVL